MPRRCHLLLCVFERVRKRALAAINNQAMLLADTAHYELAEPLHKKSLRLAEKSFGLDHPQVAICLNNLAQLLVATNRLAEAEPLMHRALEPFSARSSSL